MRGTVVTVSAGQLHAHPTIGGAGNVAARVMRLARGSGLIVRMLSRSSSGCVTLVARLLVSALTLAGATATVTAAAARVLLAAAVALALSISAAAAMAAATATTATGANLAVAAVAVLAAA